MRRPITITSIAAAIGLALSPLAAGAAPRASHEAATYAGLSELAASATLIDAWRDYALATLRPDFSWASGANEPLHAPSLFDTSRGRLLPPPSRFDGSVIETSPLHVALASTRVSDTPHYLPASGANLLPLHGPGLQRYLVAPSISQQFGSIGSVSFSAIFAYQHFAEAGWVGSESAGSPIGPLGPTSLRTSDTSSGAGLRVDYTRPLTQSSTVELGLQSRINMDALNNYHGLYAETGTFDIPASANVGVAFSVSPALRLDAGVERVMYSQIAPFTSSALPPRFLALLGSSVSPEFAWQNLDVYSVGASWIDPTAGDWSLRYSTREQPQPTSRLLQQALPTPSARNYEFGYARAFGDASRLRLSASYAPTDFIVGVPLSYSVSRGGNQVQWEALWITSF